MSALSDDLDGVRVEHEGPDPGMSGPTFLRRWRKVVSPTRQWSEPTGGRPLEVELTERLDTVLGIAERLAASHDREDLFRTIVEETKRAPRRPGHDPAAAG